MYVLDNRSSFHWVEKRKNHGRKSTVLERKQHQLRRMTDFPPSVVFSGFDSQNHEVPQITVVIR